MTTEAIDMATDELNKLFDAASALLRRDFQGVYGGIFVTNTCAMSFANRDGVWGLYIESDAKSVPLTSAPREVRIACAAFLGKLRAVLVREKESLSERVQEARMQVKYFVEDNMRANDA